MTYSLFPNIECSQSGHLKVSDRHQIYYEQSGNPNGVPILYVHGGPGGGTDPHDRRYFDPKHYRIVLVDQRGCGKSTPHADLQENTTWDLVSDFEKLRTQLGIKKWVLFGGSWGSTLSLVYAETHPEAVIGLILRGIFLCRKKEIDWFYQDGASRVFPDAWDEYLKPIPENERGDLVSAYSKRLTSPDRNIRMEAARAWSIWEGSTSYFYPQGAAVENFASDRFAEAFARIECHYFTNKLWMKNDNQILNDIGRIRHLPCEVVHGRYDVVCSLENAWDLKRVWPELNLTIVPNAGHSAKEPGTTERLVAATEKFKALKG